MNEQTHVTRHKENLVLYKHYEKSRPFKPHYPTTKIQKTTHIQLLCNYPLEIRCIKLNYHVKKSISCIIVTSELKMGILYGNLHTSYIHM